MNVKVNIELYLLSFILATYVLCDCIDGILQSFHFDLIMSLSLLRIAVINHVDRNYTVFLSN